MTDGRGLSVGAGHLTAVSVGRAAVRRTAVLTCYGHRPSEVGVPSENPNLTERGLVITDFVDRVGDPVALLASDGSAHRAEALLADALRAMADTLGPSSDPIGITHPAHWRPAAVDALRAALTAVPEFRTPRPALLTSDATAALHAVARDPGLPTRGVLALCDLGGTGSSITLVDAAAGFDAIAPTERYVDLSGDLIDAALLRHVMAVSSAPGSPDATGTSAIGSLARLRAECRAAKERLSATAATSLPGPTGDVRVTRAELDDAIREPLAGFVAELRDALQRNGVRAVDLAGVVTVGGVARTPLVTTTLSEYFRVPVIAAPHPELTAAIGAGLTAARGTVADVPTSVAPAAAVVAAASAPTGLAPAAPEPPAVGAAPALAWSQADDDDVPDVASGPEYDPYGDPGDPYDPDDPGDRARPRLAFADPEPVEARPVPWYRNPFVMMAAGLAVVLAAVGVALVVVLGDDEEQPATTATTTPGAPTSATSPAAPAPGTEVPPSATERPAEPRTAAPTQAPPATVTEQAPPPQATSQAPPPPSTTDAPPPPATTQAPPPTTTQAPPPSTQQPVIPTLPYQTIPGLPFVPSPFQPQQP